MPPIIGIITTSGEDKTKPYIDTIVAHGGKVILVDPKNPPSKFNFDGLLLTGGGDLSENYYEHRLSPSERKTLGKIEPEREACEKRAMKWAIKNKIPTLGICRGCQMMNIFHQGTLIPDIPTWYKKRCAPLILPHRNNFLPSAPAHEIHLESGTKLQKILNKKRIKVNSSHHQALGACASSLKISAWAPDGIIEAIEDPKHPFWIGVQFHPERMWKRLPIFSKLFRSFMEHARRKAR